MQMMVRQAIAPEVVRVLKQDDADAGLISAIHAGEMIDLATPRSPEAAAHDRQSPTTAGYLLGLCRDTFELGCHDWRVGVALGALAADIEALIEETTGTAGPRSGKEEE